MANRRASEDEARRNLARAHRTGEPLSFALLDLDHFKVVNDKEGHGAGDALLCQLTAGWSRRLRGADLLGRYGGDDFVLCLPGTDEDGAWHILQQLDETHPFPWSFGVATAGKDDTLGTVLARPTPPLPNATQRPHGLIQGRRQSSDARCEPAIGPSAACRRPPPRTPRSRSRPPARRGRRPPRRPRGRRRAGPAARRDDACPVVGSLSSWPVIGVAISPGATALTVMPCSASSRAATRVSSPRPPLAAQ